MTDPRSAYATAACGHRPGAPAAAARAGASVLARISAVAMATTVCLVPLAGAVLTAADAAAQQAATPAKGTAKAKSAAKGEGGGGSGAAASGSEGGLKSRVDQLEEQLVDMQVVIGTLESLARQGASSSPAAAPRASSSGGGLGGGDQARLDTMETQIRALTQQLEQLSEQVRQRRSDAGSAPGATYAAAPPPAPPQFGSTSVTGGDPIGSLISGGPAASPAPAVPAPVSQAPLQAAAVAAPGGADAGNTKQAYETAYGYLLQQDYGAAEAAFDDFLKKYPSDPLAGNAQYWLGESYFVRGQYKQAAGAFLKGYQTYGKSAKAPDSLLKLAMSLDRLGQKEAACSSYGELSTRFPAAAQHIKSRAQSERARLACS